MGKTFLGAFCLALAASIWGGMYVVSKYVLTYIPPFTLLWLRYGVAFIVLWLIMRCMPRPPIPRRDWWQIAWVGFVGYFVSVGAQFLGTRLSDAHTGALITSASPAFVILFARFMLQEPVTARKLFSLILSGLGVVLVIGWSGDHGSRLWGDFFLLAAAVTWALLSIYAKRASATQPPLTVTTYALFFALLFTTPVMLGEWYVEHPPLPRDPWILWGVLYLGVVSTAGAFYLWNKGMQLMEAGTGSLFFFFQPVVGSFLGWLLLGEQLYWNFYVGAVLIIAGVAAISVPSEQERT